MRPQSPYPDVTAKVAESELVIAGLILGLQDREMMMKQPKKTPAQPASVTARPAMNALLFGANPSYRQHAVCPLETCGRALIYRK